MEALADVEVEGRRALVARAAEARDVLPDALRERGAEVTVLPLYDTVAETLDAERVARALASDYVTFTSSSTVRFFLETVGGASALSERCASSQSGLSRARRCAIRGSNPPSRRSSTTFPDSSLRCSRTRPDDRHAAERLRHRGRVRRSPSRRDPHGLSSGADHRHHSRDPASRRASRGDRASQHAAVCTRRGPRRDRRPPGRDGAARDRAPVPGRPRPRRPRQRAAEPCVGKL